MEDRQLRLTETFATYASMGLSDDFWDDEWHDWVYSVTMPEGDFTGGSWTRRPIEELVPRDRGLLKRALKKSYVARSGFVHTGERSVDLPSELAAQTIPGRVERLTFPALRLVLRGLISAELKRRRASAAELPPLVFTFETSD